MGKITAPSITMDGFQSRARVAERAQRIRVFTYDA